MRRRTILAIGVPVAVVLVAAAVAAVVWQPWRDLTPAAATEKPATVKAERTTLTSDLLLSGDLTYGDTIQMPGRQGIVTWLPSVGAVIAVGHSVYEVDGRPVIAVQGSRPFWRDLRVGIDDGPDVLQLEQALAALGYGAHVTVDTHFTSATAAAVKAWQKALGLARTGVVGLGDVVAINAPSVRISEVTAKLGDPAGGNPLSYTSTTIRAVADLTDAQARELVAPTAVTVRLPDGTEIPAKITLIDPGGVPTGEGNDTTSASAVIEFADQKVVEAVGLRSVKVTIARDEVADALVVPVTALLATLDGGYAVDVVRKGKTVRVPVQLGLIADTRVQITGGDLKEGDDVVVAS
jgi:hypothetical protein